MAGTTQNIKRFWGKATSSVANFVIDGMRAFYEQHNLIITDLENVRATAVKSGAFSSAGLAIKAGGSTLAKAATAFRYASGAGLYGLSAANTDMAALSGTVVNATFNVFFFSATYDGTTFTVVTRMGTAGATRGAVVFPTIPSTDVRIGFVEINPTGTGNFVGGTTALDDGTVVPNAVYVNLIHNHTFGAMSTAAGLAASSIATVEG